MCFIAKQHKGNPQPLQPLQKENKRDMKKALLTLTLMLVASVTTLAQTTKDVVYLKDGNVIRGELVEIIPDKQVKIKTADGSLFVYSTNDIARIENAEIAKFV